MAGPVALPERGLALPADRPVQRTPPPGAGKTGPIRTSTPQTLAAPMPLGAMYGGTQKMYLPGVLPVGDPRSDFHPTDPSLPRFVAIPRRGQYGSDSHVLGPAAPGGNRGIGGLAGTQRRRNEALPGIQGGLGRFIYGAILSMLSPPSEWHPARPYFANRYGTQGFQPPTRVTILGNGATGSTRGAEVVDPGNIDNKRYDQLSFHQEFGNSSTRFLRLPLDRIDNYQKTNIRKLSTRPQMHSPHDYQLANIPPASSVGSRTQSLDTGGTASIPAAGGA